MKVTQEKLPASQLGLQIEISPETSKGTYEKVINNLAKTSNIPGFRRGKVPRQVILQRMGSERVKAVALEEIIEEGVKQAVEQESIQPLGNYKLVSEFEELLKIYKPGEPFIFSASMDISPEVILGDYQNISIKAVEVTYDPSEIDKLLEQRQISQSTEVPIEDRGAQMGDVAFIDFQGYLKTEEGEKGDEAPGVQGSDYKLELDTGKFIDGFVEGILGMKPQESKEMTLRFPEDYHSEDLAGNEVIFSISLKELKGKELPPLDDDFAKEISDFQTMEELRQSLETQFKEKAARETKSNIHQEILAELVKRSTVEPPETMIQKEVEVILTQTAMQMQQMGIDLKMLFTPQSLPQMRETSKPEAIQRIKESLVIQAIASRELLKPSAEEIKTRIETVKEELSDQKIDEERLKQVVQDELIAEKTLDWLQEKAQVELVPKGTLTTEEESEPEIENATVEDESNQ